MFSTKNGQSNEIGILSRDREKMNKLCISVNPESPTRGVSLDNNKLTPKGITQLAFSKLVTQTNRDTHNINKFNHIPEKINEKEKIHSMSPQKKIFENNFLLPTQKSNKKTLVLDLDETLIHSGFHSFNCGNDIILKIEIEKQINDIYVVKRPGVDEFLKRMSKLYEIVIFTASLSKYADPLMDILDKDRICDFRLFRDSCTMLNGFYVKELKRLNRNMKNVILLDNNPASYYLDTENGVPIKSFYDDKTDNELKLMTYVLENIAKINDVREVIKEIVYMNQVDYDRVRQIFSSIKEEKIMEEKKAQNDKKENSRYINPSNFSSNQNKNILPLNTYQGNTQNQIVQNISSVINTSQSVSNQNTKINTVFSPKGKVEESKNNKLKILSVDILTKEHNKISLIKSPKQTKQTISPNSRPNTSSKLFKSPNLVKIENEKNKNSSTSSIRFINTSSTANTTATATGSNFLRNSSENSKLLNLNTTQYATNKENLSKTIYDQKQKLDTKRPSSVNTFKSQVSNTSNIKPSFARTNTATTKDTSSSNNLKNQSTSLNKRNFEISKNYDINRKISNNVFKRNACKINPIINKSKLNDSSLKTIENDGNNTARITKASLLKNVLTLSAEKSITSSPSKKFDNALRESKDSRESSANKLNPKSARVNYGSYITFKKDVKDRPSSSKEKFSSVITDKSYNNKNLLSTSTTSSLTKLKSSSFNSKSNVGDKVAIQKDLKILKIESSKKFFRSKTASNKDKDK